MEDSFTKRAIQNGEDTVILASSYLKSPTMLCTASCESLLGVLDRVPSLVSNRNVDTAT